MQGKVHFNERDFFKQPFTGAEIKELLYGRPAAEMFSPSFKKLALEADSLDNDRLIELMLQEPRLVRRPVVRMGKAAYFGADRKKLEGVIKTH